MKRIVEHVGIGDAGTLSGTLQIAPLHEDDVALLILGSQNGSTTQSADYLQIRNSSGTALACATSGGALYAQSMVTPLITPTRIDTTNVYATTVTATNLCGGVAVGNYTPLYTHTVGICATAGTTVATATYIAVPASSTVFIHALVSTFETSGISAAGAGGYEVIATASSGGKVVTSVTYPATAIAQGQSVWTTSVVAGVGKVALTVTGSGATAGWAYVLDTCRITCAA